MTYVTYPQMFHGYTHGLKRAVTRSKRLPMVAATTLPAPPVRGDSSELSTGLSTSRRRSYPQAVVPYSEWMAWRDASATA